MTTIYPSMYKGIEGISVENGTLSAVFLPSQGAKLCSLKSKLTDYEYIYQGKTTKYRMATYGQSYLEGECAGIDEIFPNIDAFYYDMAPWEGSYFPDHGEVWALPWEYEIEGECLKMSTVGVKLPYRLMKRVSMTEDGKLHIEYEVENLSCFAMDYIWASHMMFTAEEGCQFEFEENLSRAYVTMSDSGTIGGYGDTFYYPFAKQRNKIIYDMRVHRGMTANDYQKIYFADKLKADQGWGRIVYPDESSLTITFPIEEIPYLGIIQAEGGELDLRCMFMEPCTGAFDRPDIAKLHGMNSVLQAKEKKCWYLDIQLFGKEAILKSDKGVAL